MVGSGGCNKVEVVLVSLPLFEGLVHDPRSRRTIRAERMQYLCEAAVRFDQHKRISAQLNQFSGGEPVSRADLKSFGVRLLHINYVDTEGRSSRTKYGFVIEDDDDVADRNGMKSINIGDVTHDDLDPRQQNLVYMFQYMIGNTDFSLINGPEISKCCHNSKLLSGTGGAPFTPLPYDFDFSGLVKAPYATPDRRFRLASVRSRLYRGHCGNNDLLPDTFRLFLDRKDAVYAIVDELEIFTANTRRSVIRYLDSFYDCITRPEAIAVEFTDKCAAGGTT